MSKTARIPLALSPLSPWRAACIGSIAAELFDLSGDGRPVPALARDYIEEAFALDPQTDDAVWKGIAEAIQRCVLLGEHKGGE